MKNNKIIILLSLHIIFFILGTTFFVLLFHTPILKEFVFFYRGIALLSLATFLMAFFMFVFRKYRYGEIFIFRDVILSITILFCINLVFFTHVPVTADRSISVFLLGYMSNHSDKFLNKEEITRIFIDKFLVRNDSLQKRFYEQVVSGNIQEDRSSYHITEQGKLLMLFYNFISDVFVIDKKNISQ